MGIHLQLQMKRVSACIVFMLLVHAPDNTLLLTAGAYEPLHGAHKLLLTVINPCVSGPVRSKGILVLVTSLVPRLLLRFCCILCTNIMQWNWEEPGNKATYACFDFHQASSLLESHWNKEKIWVQGELEALTEWHCMCKQMIRWPFCSMCGINDEFSLVSCRG